MKLTPSKELNLAKKMVKQLKDCQDFELVVCPSFVGLAKVAEAIKGSNIKLGAQDVFWRKIGAYTGEISSEALEDIGCQYAIIGHSERRQNLHETNEMINLKIDACLAGELIPILCVGETMAEKQTGATDNVIARQLTEALDEIDLVPKEKLIIAYEPVWAIGSGSPVDPEDLTHILNVIKRTLIDIWPKYLIEESVRLIYGGSVDEKNVTDLKAVALLSGFLVGSAGLEARTFASIVKDLR